MEIMSDYYSTPKDKIIVQELEGLIALAEDCVKKIDSLTAAMEKVRVYFIVLLVVASLMLGACIGFASDVQKTGVTFFNAESVVIFFAIFASVFVTGISWVLVLGVFRRRNLSRELEVEKDVHDRLISLIHEQIQRVAHRNSVSPVTYAMYEIRVRRLMR